MTRSLAAQFSIETIRLDGGRPCLDFVNTIHDRSAALPLDYLATPADYVQWCLRAGLLLPGEARGMTFAASGMGEIRAFREHLHVLFQARIAASSVPASALRAYDRWLHRAWADLSLDLSLPGCVSWARARIDADLPLKRIALSALEVLRAADSRRLKRCAAQACGWLFYDDSKGGQRRWCAMQACGTIEKMRRYRR